MAEMFGKPDYRGFCRDCRSFDGNPMLGKDPNAEADVSNPKPAEKKDKNKPMIDLTSTPVKAIGLILVGFILVKFVFKKM